MPANNHNVVLWIDLAPPQIDSDSGCLDAFNYVRVLREIGYEVLALSTNMSLPAPTDMSARTLEAIGVEHLPIGNASELQAILERYSERCKLVFLSRPDVANQYLPVVRKWAPDAKVIYNTVDLHYARMQRLYEVTKSTETYLQSEQLRKLEVFAAESCDATICISNEEKSQLSSIAPAAQIFTIPIFREIPGRTGSWQSRNCIAYIGNFSVAHNVDALNYFLNNVWPLCRARVPRVRLLVCGADMPTDWRNINAPGVEWIGYVPNLEDVLSKCLATVAPLRFGAGQKGKIVSSLAHGVPVIATNVAAIGMNLSEDDGLLVRNDAMAMAQEVARIYGMEENAWLVHSNAAAKSAERNHSFSAGQELLKNLIAEVTQSGGLTRLPRVNLVRTSLGQFLLFASRDHISQTLYFTDQWESDVLSLARMCVNSSHQSSSVILDIGANLGAFSVPMALAFPRHRVFAFEAQRILFYQLCGNVFLNSLSNVEPHMLAVGDPRVDNAVISVPRIDWQYETNIGGVSLDPEVLRKKNDTFATKLPSQADHVPLIGIDGLEIDNVCLVKIDVEGMELEVLRGAQETLVRSNRPPLILEAWSDSYAPWYRERKQELFRWLADFGYGKIEQFGDTVFARSTTQSNL